MPDSSKGMLRTGVIAGHVRPLDAQVEVKNTVRRQLRVQYACNKVHLMPAITAVTPAPLTRDPVPEALPPSKIEKKKELPVVPVTHPLDPLTPQEIAAVAQIVRDHANFDIRFEGIELLEPSKAYVRSWRPGAPISRMARATAFRRGELGAFKAEVDFSARKVMRWDYVPGARPMIDVEDMKAAWKACYESKTLAAALTKRGLTVAEEFLHIEPWPVGQASGFPKEWVEGRAPILMHFWERLHNLDNHYAHPIEGLNVVFDRMSGEILHVYDDLAELPVPKNPVNYRVEENQMKDPNFKPLIISQPDGVSFTLENRSLSWYKWKLHIGFSYREGLILSDISFDGRSVCYDARISEMVVPYGGPHHPNSRKSVFDIGEAGFGVNANELQLGCDCKGSIQYLDAWMPTAKGNSRCIKNAVCIHEEDHGMLWKHTDHRGPPEVRRARRLVISSVHTVGNYEYACYWYFMMDATIEFEMKATGIINTTGKAPDQEKFAVEVSPGVWGQVHQHLFTAKLDMAVDGDSNTVVECNTVSDPMGSPGNPLGNAFYVAETPLTSELQASRTRSDDTMRFWKFTNPHALNGMGKPTAYKLEPTKSVRPMASPESEVGKRMSIYYKDLWVSAYNRDERYPAGEFMHQSLGEDGLTRWTKADRPLVNTDVVVWYNFGLHHVTRPEDWPVQPVVSTGFMLHPTGFFDLNPCIDLAPEKDTHSKTANANCH